MSLNPESRDAKFIFQNLSLMRSKLLIQITNRRGGVVTEAEALYDLYQFNEDSRAQKNTARDFELAVNENEIVAISHIDEAIAHLKSGSYGQCLECSALISQKRLIATPEAIRCLACQKKLEQKLSAVNFKTS